MCGISGIVKLDATKVRIEDLQSMSDALIHRGPDGEGHWVSPSETIGLAHRRLSIIDLSTLGEQPMHYKERYTITFNGEIYNYLELRETLIKAGYHFESNSDTEVLLALFDQKKEKCLNDLDGMFAFAIWDEREQTLFCARDRFGEKPFYYTRNAKQFVFASEMKAIWAIGIPKIPDDEKFKKYIEYNIVSEANCSKTFFKEIEQLDAACYLLLKPNAEVIKVKYYSLDQIQINNSISFQQATEKLYDLLFKSVKWRLRSDVPVGSSLSGGLDSSSIVKIIDKIKGTNHTQKTFTARFKNFSKDEGVFADQVINSCANIQAHNVWPDEEGFINDLENLVYYQEEPFATSSIYAQYKVMELAKENNITVLLDGQGADEQLAGYISYYRTYLNQLFYHEHKNYTKEFEAYNKLHGKLYPLMNLSREETSRMKLGKWKRKILSQKLPVEKNALKQNLRNDMQRQGLKNLLRYADRNSMAHSREVRLPFLSHSLVDFIFSLPDAFLLHEGWTKYVLRMAMGDHLPQEIIWRVDKIGYETPQESWMKSQVLNAKISNYKKYYSDFITGTETSDWQLLMLGSYYK